MIALDRRNPLVALVKSKEPDLNDAQAYVTALEARDKFAGAIKDLGTLARQTLLTFGDGSDPANVKHAMYGFVHGIAAGRTAIAGKLLRNVALGEQAVTAAEVAAKGAAVAVLVVVYPALHERIQTVTDPDAPDVEGFRKLLLDCEAMLNGGPAAE